MHDVITFGTATRDSFIKSDDFVIIESGKFKVGKAECLPLGSKIEVKEMVFSTGGGATNAAVTFSRHGLKVAPVCRVGDDVSGREIKGNLEQENIDISLLQSDDKLRTGYSIILLTSEGDRTVLVFRGASRILKGEDVDWSNIKAKWFYITSLAGNIELLERIADFAEKNSVNIAIDPGGLEIKEHKDALKEILKKINILKLNREEASYLSGMNYDEAKDILSHLCGITKDMVIMTDGPGGVWLCDGKQVLKAGVYKEERVADRTGAGDAFGSGFIASLINNPGNLEQAVKFASANATSVVEHIGAKKGILHKNDIEQERWKDFKIEAEKL